MLLSDYISKCIEENGIKNVFVFTGGSSARLIDSIGLNKNLNYFCNLHEQASSMAADAASRLSDNMSAVIVTSGPGATNLVTGCAGAFYDSIPVLFITGQVANGYLKKEMNIRQNGFQETDVIPMFSGITKYAVRVTDPRYACYEISKAIEIATSGRKGPVLVDIPEDIQRLEINEEDLIVYNKIYNNSVAIAHNKLHELTQLLQNAKRPLIVSGQGIHCAKAEVALRNLIDHFQMPSVFTYAALDILSFDHPLNYGNFGINGHPIGNALIQNADLLLILGTRLDHHLSGKNRNLFAPNAKKILIEIDEGEIEKFSLFSMHMDLIINADAKDVLELMNTISYQSPDNWKNIANKQRDALLNNESTFPAVIFNELSSLISKNSVIVFDTGCSLIWGMHYFKFKSGQRCISEFNHTAMGYALPAAIGAAWASPDKMIVCITGDGGIQLNIQELAVIQKQQLNIKIVVFDNSAYGLMLGAQNTHMDGRHTASTTVDGLSMPDLKDVINGYHIPYITINESDENLHNILKQPLNIQGPMCIIIKITTSWEIENQVASGEPLSSEIILDL